MSDQIWFKDPSVLFSPDRWYKFVPLQTMTVPEALNAVVRFTIYFSVILYATTTISAYIVAIPIVMAATVVLVTLFPNGKTLESFKVQPKDTSGKYTMPTAENPFMNVLLTEIVDDPDRPDAAPINRRDVKAEIHKSFQKTADLHMDTTDLFDQSQAMRTFHTLQSATVPNDLDGFKKWIAKGIDEPDHSSAFPARNAKILSEGHVKAKGSLPDLPSSTAKPAGRAPSASPTK